jgi:hypothetical protein
MPARRTAPRSSIGGCLLGDKERAVRPGGWVEGAGVADGAQVGRDVQSKYAACISSRRTEWHRAKPEDFTDKRLGSTGCERSSRETSGKIPSSYRVSIFAPRWVSRGRTGPSRIIVRTTRGAPGPLPRPRLREGSCTMRHSDARLALAAGVLGLFVIAGPARTGIVQEEFAPTSARHYVPGNERASGWAYGCYADNGYGRRSCGVGASRIGEGDGGNRLPPPGETPSRVAKSEMRTFEPREINKFPAPLFDS